MVRVEQRFDEFTKKLEKATAKAQYLVSSQVLADSNRHARRYTGDLIRSSETMSNLKEGELVWDTPYAKKVYFTGTPNTDANHNPEAVLMWVDYAYDRYHKDWNLIVLNTLKEVTE